MPVIKQFVASYERELDFYATAATLVRQLLEAELRENGIRAILSSRAKRPDSLEKKLRKKEGEGHEYRDADAIRTEVRDFAGARVAGKTKCETNDMDLPRIHVRPNAWITRTSQQ